MAEPGRVPRYKPLQIRVPMIICLAFLTSHSHSKQANIQWRYRGDCVVCASQIALLICSFLCLKLLQAPRKKFKAKNKQETWRKIGLCATDASRMRSGPPHSEGIVVPGIDHHQPSLQSTSISPSSGIESLLTPSSVPIGRRSKQQKSNNHNTPASCQFPPPRNGPVVICM